MSLTQFYMLVPFSALDIFDSIITEGAIILYKCFN